MIFWCFNKTCDIDSDEPAQVCILNTALAINAVYWLRYVKHLTAINFVFHDSNHNLEKGPFVYKFV